MNEVARIFDEEHKKLVEDNASAAFSGMLGKPFSIKLTKLEKGARRTVKLVHKYLSFDTNVDAEVVIDGQTMRYDAFCHELVLKIARGECPEYAPLAPFVAAVSCELMVAGNTIINCTIPAAVAAAMGLHTPEEAATLAEQGAYIAIGVPGGKAAATVVGTMAKKMMDAMNS